MDLATITGVLLLAGISVAGVYLGQFSLALINLHGVLLVFGGTGVAMLINTPARYLIKALREIPYVFRDGGESRLETMVPALVSLGEQCRLRGLAALKDADPALADGFLARAAAAAMEYNDTAFVRQVLEQEINMAFEEINEVANIYRTMGVMAPMFGLLGTLVGIIGVLKELSNPEGVGPAMAVAITSAFYGILYANVVCVPMAGKIRARAMLQTRMRTMILEGILEIMKGSLPIVIERRMQSFL